LIGLITYMRFTGNLEPLATCRRMGDLLCRTFGDGPGQRDIIRAGHHVGMAPTSVLEPMVLLYRFTGEPRYLDFCNYILRAWEQPNGPKIISTLLTQKRVDKVGNGKAYEMLSCLNGALEYYRTMGGDRQILQACLNAWQDIVDKRLYITGAASYGELFHDDFDLPNVNNVGETCVTVTWLQFNAHLLRLTGDARFAEQLEHVVLNQLFGAQRPDGAAWGYYVEMEGKKPYSSTLDGHCCLSSGPRGVALIPTFAVTTDSEGAVVNLYDAAEARLTLRDGSAVLLVMETLYPTDGRIQITVNPTARKAFTLKLRVPSWYRASIDLNHRPLDRFLKADGYMALKRTWRRGDVLELRLQLEPRVVAGDHKNAGKAAVFYGPLVLAADEALLVSLGAKLSTVSLPAAKVAALGFNPELAPEPLRNWEAEHVYRVHAVARRSTDAIKAGSAMDIQLVPFAEAGSTGSLYKVWLPLYQTTPNGNLLQDGRESRSRDGNVDGSINDDDFQTCVVTFNNQPADEDWFAVTLDEPVTVGRVVFAHGKTFHDGGWFDASAGKPRVQAQLTKGGPWETVGELIDYPPTTASSAPNLKRGNPFNCRLSTPRSVYGVRVIGKPACGDKPQQAFSSCAELQAYK
jgi:hypothetical protein